MKNKNQEELKKEIRKKYFDRLQDTFPDSEDFDRQFDCLVDFTIKKAQENFNKKIDELKTYLNSFYGENNGWCKKIDEIFQDNTQGQVNESIGNDVLSGRNIPQSAPEDVCAKQKGCGKE